MPFLKTSILVETGDGHHCILREPLVYVTNAGETITVPVGAETDGASTPSPIWGHLPPFGTYWLAAAMHDWLYRKTKRERPECDALFLEAMESLRVPLLIRETIYKAVRLAGKGAFEEDRRFGPVPK